MNAISSVILSTVFWAGCSTLIVMCLSLPLAYGLARYRFRGKYILSTLVSLPLVLPPTAVGYLLLQLLADEGLLGRHVLGIDLGILFDWKGVILACSVMSFPLVVRTARVSFEAVNPRLEVMARTLGFGRVRTFFRITLPLAARGLMAAAILGFTRAMGEFGATVMIAGNIPGRTQTLSSAIYSAQQAGNDARGNTLLVIALCVGFLSVFLTEWLSRSPEQTDTHRGYHHG
jgi:molybdate transport system permease protein